VGTHVGMFPAHYNGHAVVSLIIIRSLQWAHTLVCFPSHLQWPCRCFSDNNSELTVGTHVGMFPAHLQRPCRYFSDTCNNSKLAHTLVCSQRIYNGHAVVSHMIIRILQWAHTLVCSHRICYGRAVASLIKIKNRARTLVCSQCISNSHTVASLIIIRSLQWAHT
jgi:hypothetical protein